MRLLRNGTLTFINMLAVSEFMLEDEIQCFGMRVHCATVHIYPSFDLQVESSVIFCRIRSVCMSLCNDFDIVCIC